MNMSSSNWRDGEIRELLTIVGEKVTQSHNAFNKDVEKWCDLRETRRGTVLPVLYTGKAVELPGVSSRTGLAV